MTPFAHRRSGRPLLGVLGTVGVALGVVAAAVLTARSGVRGVEVEMGLPFGILIAAGELLRVAVPSDRELAPLAHAGSLGFAMLFSCAGMPVRMPLAWVVCVVAGGSLAGASLHGIAGRGFALGDIARRVAVAAAVSSAIHARPELWQRFTLRSLGLTLVLLATAAVAMLADHVLAEFAAGRRRRVFSPLVADDGVTGATVVAIGATAVLMALGSGLMGLWALPALTATLLVAQFSLRRYAHIRSTYRQTIRSLARMPEVGGYVAPGHAIRVAELAVGMGRELGLGDGDLLDLEYAGLMHDIGQLSLQEPIAGGSTLAVPPVERRRIAEQGAQVIRSTGALGRVAHYVERQADPYRRNRRPADPTLPLASRVVKVASAYDDIVATNPTDPTVCADAIERLRLGMAYEYDPRVVDALVRVVDREAYGAVRR